MQPFKHHTLAPGALACVLISCTKPTGDEIIFEAETGDSGLFSLDLDLPADDTEGDPPPFILPTGECIQLPIPNVHGYVHQCRGNATVSFVGMNGDDTYEGADNIIFGPGAANPTIGSMISMTIH